MAEPMSTNSPCLADVRMPDGMPVAGCDAPVGGQAVLEGVMMRGVSTWSVAVRTPEGEIDVTSEPLVCYEAGDHLTPARAFGCRA